MDKTNEFIFSVLRWIGIFGTFVGGVSALATLVLYGASHMIVTGVLACASLGLWIFAQRKLRGDASDSQASLRL